MDAITSNELFDRCYQLATTQTSDGVNRLMHETMILACTVGTQDTGMGFGNVFAQIDYICKIKGISRSDRMAIQQMRRHSNSSDLLKHDDLMYDIRALCLLISAVFSVDIPHCLTQILPTENKTTSKGLKINNRYIRCIVKAFCKDKIEVTCDHAGDTDQLTVLYPDADTGINLTYLNNILHEGMQLNLLDCHRQDNIVIPQLIVVEPDYLIDISSIAACFSDYGHHPIAYTINKMRERSNTQPILLGNFAGMALDDIINNKQFKLNTTIMNSFKEQALQFCTCEHFDADAFIKDAAQQANNLQEIVKILFNTYSRDKAILEPSFVCERLGLQGRVDLMTTDMKLLVEQKSGKNMNIEHGHTGRYDSFQREDHYVQLLLYYGVLKHNFHLSEQTVDIRLLYSRYPAHSGLLVVNYLQQLFHEAIKFRNILVAQEYRIAKEGFDEIIPLLNPQTVNTAGNNDRFFTQWIEPQILKVTQPLLNMSTLEHDYFVRMMNFVYREQQLMKVGSQEGAGNSVADLWNMPLHAKQESGNIYIQLSITNKQKSSEYSGYDIITLSVPVQGNDFLPNFRQGDLINLYAYHDQPDIRNSIVFKGQLISISTHQLIVKLNDGQQNEKVFTGGYYALEHGYSEVTTTASIRSLHQFITAPESRRQLLLGQRNPTHNSQLALAYSYNPTYDDILLKIKQANDYFLLVGPPGTGKTSMALRYIVSEELTSQNSNVLLMSYTNRAVDEICEMLVNAKIDFLRIGNQYSCDPRFRSYLLESALQDKPQLTSMKQKIRQTKVIVSTTSTLQARPFIFSLKHFTLAVVDESSQILEPSLIGLLAAHNSNQQCCIDRFVLIGDYKQLPAVVQQSENESAVKEQSLRDIMLTNCRNSLFERLIQWEKYKQRKQFIGILHYQGRMHPEIAFFPNTHFYKDEQLECVPLQHQKEEHLPYNLPSIDHLDDILKKHRMLFIPSQSYTDINLSEKVNKDEAKKVALLLERIHRFYGKLFNAEKTVGVIVPYRNQIAMIRREIEYLKQKNKTLTDLDNISIDTVERYQGSQRDVIIYSFTIQHYYQMNFLTANCFIENGNIIDRKLNVAITRARKQMIMLGNQQILKTNPLFKELIIRYSIHDALFS